jgi:hypothetical protein
VCLVIPSYEYSYTQPLTATLRVDAGILMDAGTACRGTSPISVKGASITTCSLYGNVGMVPCPDSGMNWSQPATIVMIINCIQVSTANVDCN